MAGVINSVAIADNEDSAEPVPSNRHFRLARQAEIKTGASDADKEGSEGVVPSLTEHDARRQ